MIGNAVNFLIVHWAIFVPLVLVALLLVSSAFRSGVALLLRLIARPLLLLAVLALVYDGTRTLAGGSGLVITSLADHWQAFHPASLEATKAALARLHPLAWDQGVGRLIRLPAWLLVGVLGMLLAYIGRKRRPVNVFIN